MPRRGAKAPSAETRSTGGSVTVVSGSIRTPDDPDALSVKLSIWDTEITMRVDGAELGNWQASEVRIRPIDASSFEFTAEGDQLVFTPDDPAAFAASSLVNGRISGGGRKSRRKAKKKEEAAPASAVVADSSSSAKNAGATQQTAKVPRPSKPSRRERKAAAKAQAEREAAELTTNLVVSPAPRKAPSVRQEAVPTPIGDSGVASEAIADGDTVTAAEPPGINIPAFSKPVPEPVVESESMVVSEPVVVPAPIELPDPEPVEPPEPAELQAQEPLEVPEKPLPQRKSLLRRTAREEIPDEAIPDEPMSDEPMSDEPEERRKDQPNRMWIRALDMARKYDFLGLDRVPVNESLRGQEHQHTWDHRVAPSSGPGKYICTLCGEIRR